jgi:hypothetical protein
VGILSKLLSSSTSKNVRTTADRPYRISNPTIGFLNLQGTSGAELAGADRRVLGSLFANVRESASEVPRCDVLFIYCTIHPDGSVVGSLQPVREVIKNAGAYVAVVAAENPPEAYVKGLGKKGDWSANIVMTLDRKDPKFSEFFARLFESMFNGRSMLLTWVQLAPQMPGREHPDAPGTIMAAEAGHLAFQRG